ncbi:MAG: hypothetical protein WC509_02105 [Candidatus Izemoplasmatales bacterium]
MKQQRFEEYMNEITRSRDMSGFPADLLQLCHRAYDLGLGVKQILDGTIAPVKAAAWINSQLQKNYKIQLHGVGKNPFQRFYAREDHNVWLKLEHYLIVHLYSIRKDHSYIQNRTIAEKLGWLATNERDLDTIARAERKVADALQILKQDRKTFTVEQIHTHGKTGSAHRITANWLNIIPLYSLYDPDRAISIRMRKGVRYRIFSLVKQAVKTFTEGLKHLLKAQRRKYLADLITMDEIEFKDAKDIWKAVIQDCELEHDELDDLDQIIPEYTAECRLALRCKTKRAYRNLYMIEKKLQRSMKSLFNRDLVLVASYILE